MKNVAQKKKSVTANEEPTSGRRLKAAKQVNEPIPFVLAEKPFRVRVAELLEMGLPAENNDADVLRELESQMRIHKNFRLGIAAELGLEKEPYGIGNTLIDVLRRRLAGSESPKFLGLEAKTLADLGLTPERAANLFDSAEEATIWSDSKTSIASYLVHDALERGHARALYESFGLLVVLVTSEAPFDGESIGDVLALSWQGHLDGARITLEPEVRRIGYVDSAVEPRGRFFDVIDIKSAGCEMWPLRAEKKPAEGA